LLWILKDIIAFPFVWHSYDSKTRDATHSMIGKQGIAQERLDPNGYVRIGNELWKAEVTNNHSYIGKGESVTVLHMDGLKLTVVSNS
jgi:membrane-bound ClpP family serine protease